MAGSGSEQGSGMSFPRLLVEGAMPGGEESLDKYTAGIELSNACRRFYVSRLAAAEKAKQRLGLNVTACTSVDIGEDAAELDSNPGPSDTCISNGPSKEVSGTDTCEDFTKQSPGSGSTLPNTRLENSMELLKCEMASLIDQDLALMRQLLTLNEQIEELKWQRKLCGYSRGSTESSCTMGASLATLSDTDLEETSRTELRELSYKYPSPSSLSLFREQLADARERCSRDNLAKNHSSSSLRNFSRVESPLARTDSSPVVTNKDSHLTQSSADTRKSSSDSSSSNSDINKKGQGDQHSFDSGIHEPEYVPQEVLL